MTNRKKIKKVMTDDFDQETNYNRIINRIDKSKAFHCYSKYAFVSIIILVFFLGIFSIGNISPEDENYRLFSKDKELTNEVARPASSSKAPNTDGTDKELSYSPFGLNSPLYLYYDDDIRIYVQGLDKVNITINSKSFDLKEYLSNSKKTTSKTLDDIIKKLKKDNNYNSLKFEVYHDENNLTIIKCNKAKNVYIGNNKMLINDDVCN